MHHVASSSTSKDADVVTSTIPKTRNSESLVLVTSVKENHHNQIPSTSFASTCVPCISFPNTSLSSVTSYNKSEEAATSFSQKAETFIYSERDSTKCSLSTHPSKFEIKLDIKFENSKVDSKRQHRGFELCSLRSNESTCSEESSSFENSIIHKDHSLTTKDDIRSTKSTPTSEEKQGRRKRIAAQFSSPING